LSGQIAELNLEVIDPPSRNKVSKKNSMPKKRTLSNGSHSTSSNNPGRLSISSLSFSSPNKNKSKKAEVPPDIGDQIGDIKQSLTVILNTIQILPITEESLSSLKETIRQTKARLSKLLTTHENLFTLIIRVMGYLSLLEEYLASVDLTFSKLILEKCLEELAIFD